MRLKEDDSSWRASGIKRRDFRHDPGLPETEAPRHRGKRKKNHVHKYKCVIIGSTPYTRTYEYGGRVWTVPYTRTKTQEICEGCGNRRSRWY